MTHIYTFTYRVRV